MASATSHTIKFTNWGHICSYCTELVLDDVKLYTLAELNPAIPPCMGITPVALFSAPNHICPGTCTNFTNLSLYCSSFVWSFPGGNPSISTDVNPTNICYNTPGTYPVSLIASNLTTSDTLTLNNYVTVYAYPPPQGILQNGDTLFANAGAVSYQWYYNGNIINGATNYYYVASESGSFNVVATDNNGCEVEAVINDVFAGINYSSALSSGLKVYPNPVSDLLFIDPGKMNAEDVQLSVINLVGEKMQVSYTSGSMFKMDVKSLPAGMYWIEATDGLQTVHSRFLKD
jgi:PKD repeat protein